MIKRYTSNTRSNTDTCNTDTCNTCNKGCCDIITQNRVYTKWVINGESKGGTPPSSKPPKAGVLFHNTVDGRVLLVESNSNFWGPPKGTLEDGETIEECALRELREETGITLEPQDISATNAQRIKIFNQAEYFYIKTNECKNIQLDINQDASGYSWVRLECLNEMVKNGNMILNSHCKRLLGIIFNMKFLVEDEFKIIK